jgi:glycosyltransferase involved in cell wall biosynthesis
VRICIVTIAGHVHGIGGMQHHTEDLARGLVGLGHEVEVITARHPEGLHEELRDGVRWRFVDAPGRHMQREWLAQSYAAFRSAAGVRSFDVIHSEGSSGLELVRRGVHRHIPLVVMFHGNFLGLAKRSVARATRVRHPGSALWEGKVLVSLCQDHFPRGNWYRFRECEAIVPSAQQLRETAISHLLNPRRVHVVPNGVDEKCFRPRNQKSVRRELSLAPGPLFVCAGRLNAEKGFHHALNALALLRARGCLATLVVVGVGAEQSRLQELARKLQLEERVSFVGAQPREKVAAYMAAADAFLFPTERDEAAPLVLPQAMACGVPVVASRVGGIPEVIDRPGENGLLVRPADRSELARAMESLAQNADLRSRLGHAARQRILAEYTVERMTERTLVVYETARLRLAKAVA